SWASKLAPSPTASMAMTEHTPNTIPRMVSPERSRCIQRLLMPSIMMRRSRAGESPAGALISQALPALIGFHHAVAQAHEALRVLADRRIVRHHDNGLALR